MNTLEGLPKGVKNEVLEMQSSVQKELAKEAASERKEGPLKLKEIKDAKTYAAIEFLSELPAWQKRFGELKNDTELSAETMNLVNGWMENPSHQYKDGNWISLGQEEQKEKLEKAKMNFEQAKAEFEGKFGEKLKIWKSKGFEVEDMDSLVKAYMADKGLDLVTTKDKKVAWGQPAAGFVAKL